MIDIKRPNFLKDTLHNCSRSCTSTDRFGGIEKLRPTQVYGQGVVVGTVAALMSMGLDFDEAIAVVKEHSPDMDINCIPPGWR